MSTANYAFDNVLIAVDDDDELAYEDTRANVVAELQKKFKHGYASEEYLNDGISRSYGGRAMFCVPVYKDGELYKTVQVISRGGYYGGFNLDYLVSESELDEVLDMGFGMAKAEVEIVCDEIADILRKHGTELVVQGIFSNGEAVYAKK